MKIVAVDNFDRDNVSDLLVCEKIGEYYGHEVVQMLNKTFGGDRFYRLVEDGYKLYDGTSVYL